MFYRRARHWGVGLCSALALLLSPWSSPVRADDSPEYQATIAEALSEFAAGNWEEAQALFREAHRLSPSARTLRGLGIVAFELRRYVDAITYLRQALDDPRKPLDASQRASTSSQIARAERFIARFDVELSPADAEIAVDGTPRALREGALLLDPGERELRIRAPGYESQRERIVVEGGMHKQLVFRLTEAGAAASQSAPSTPPASAASGDRAEGDGIPTGAVIVGSVGLAMLAASAVTGALALSAQSELEDACGSRIMNCDASNQGTADEAQTLALATDVLWIGGAAVVTSAVVWALLAGDDDEPASAGIAVGRGAARLELRGRF